MKVKELMGRLKSFNPEADVLVVFHNGVTVVDDLDGVSPGENENLVYLDTASFAATTPKSASVSAGESDDWLETDQVGAVDREGTEE